MLTSAGLAIALAVAGPGMAMAQEGAADGEPVYDTLPFSADYQYPDPADFNAADREQARELSSRRSAVDSRRRTMKRQVEDALRGRGSAAQIEPFFRGFVFPEMTQLDDETLADLGKKRERFFKDYFDQTTNAGIRGQLISLTIQVMKQVAEGNFHPAARTNAVLILGHLDTREGDRSGVLPVPVEEMLPYLLQLASTESWPEYIRAAAMSGLERHSRLRAPGSGNEISGATARQLGDAMAAMLAQQPDQNHSAASVYWMKRRAIQVLGSMGQPGDTGQYAQALRDVMANADERLICRTEAARAYSRLQFADPTAANVGDVARLVGELAVTAANADAEYIDEKINEIRFITEFFNENVAKGGGGKGDSPGRGGGGGGGGGQDDDLGGGGGGPPGTTGPGKDELEEVLPEYQRELVRRRFKGHLWSCRVALVGAQRSEDGGLTRYATAENQPLIQDLKKEFDRLMISTDVRAPEPPKDDKGRGSDDKDKGSSLFGEEKPKKPTLAEQLKTALLDGAANITAALKKHSGEGAGGE